MPIDKKKGKPISKKSKKNKKELDSEDSDFNTDIDELEKESIDDEDEMNEEEEEEDNDNDEQENTDTIEADNVTEKHQDSKCLYKFATKDRESESDDEYEEHFDDDDKIYNDFVTSEERISVPILSIYERVCLLATRAKHLSHGAKPMIKKCDKMTPEEIAKEEIEQGVIPYIIIRTLPNGKKERWHVNELEIVN